MKDFSFVLPTRGNLAELMGFITSLVDTVKDKDCFEILLAPDIDDPELERMKGMVKGYPVRVYETHPTDNFNRDYFNFLTYKAVGKNIWCINDDVVMQTKHWDEIILNKIKVVNEEKKLNGVYLVDTFDSTHEQGGNSFPRFPLISKKAVDAIGFLMFPQVRTWPADKVIYLLYACLDAVVPCHEVKIQHNWTGNNDPEKSIIIQSFKGDIENGVFPVDAYVQVYQLRKAQNPEWPGELKR